MPLRITFKVAGFRVLTDYEGGFATSTSSKALQGDAMAANRAAIFVLCFDNELVA